MQRAKKYIAIICCLLGISMLAYPMLLKGFFGWKTNTCVSVYAQHLEEKADDMMTKLRKEAVLYNRNLGNVKVRVGDPFTQDDAVRMNEYQKLMCIDDSGIMGTIEIPAIDLRYPIYHGTSEEVLNMGIGHLEGTSLPTGGKGNHVVLCGHSGLNTAKFFTDLEQLKEGDIFYIKSLNKCMIYRVENISVVEPSDISRLQRIEQKDLCTLVTCTPYGVNTHRLLVTGERLQDSFMIHQTEENDRTNRMKIMESKDYFFMVICIVGVFCLNLRFKKKFKR